MAGAGLSCALGLPNPAALVAEGLSAYETERTWRHGANLGEEMKKAFAFFYPDAEERLDIRAMLGARARAGRGARSPPIAQSASLTRQGGEQAVGDAARALTPRPARGSATKLWTAMLSAALFHWVGLGSGWGSRVAE